MRMSTLHDTGRRLPSAASIGAIAALLLGGGCDARQDFEVGKTEMTEESTSKGDRFTVRTQIRPDDEDDFTERTVVTDVMNYRDGSRHIESRTMDERGQELVYSEDPATGKMTIEVSGARPVELTNGRDGFVYYERQPYEKTPASYKLIGDSAANRMSKVNRSSVVAMGVAERAMRPRLARGQKLAVFNVFIDVITSITDALDINAQIGQGNTSSQGTS